MEKDRIVWCECHYAPFIVLEKDGDWAWDIKAQLFTKNMANKIVKRVRRFAENENKVFHVSKVIK